jgi:hypothetical protein
LDYSPARAIFMGWARLEPRRTKQKCHPERRPNESEGKRRTCFEESHALTGVEAGPSPSSHPCVSLITDTAIV